jgi:signal transduction histidine kinase
MKTGAESARRAALEAALAEARARSGAPGTAPEVAPLRERLKTKLADIPFRRRVLVAVLSAVTVPAVILSVLAIYMTQRVTRSVETDSATYNSYVGQQVAEAFEIELNAHLRTALGVAEPAIRAGTDPRIALAAVPMVGDGFAGSHFVPVNELDGFSMILVESQVLAFAPGEGRRRGQYFAGQLLHNDAGDIIGAGGWWLDPQIFIQRHLTDVVQEQIPGDERLYGGIESIRHVSIEIFGPGGQRVGAVREPADLKTARIERLSGPLERFVVRVAPTSSAGAAWTLRFVTLEIFIIMLMGLVILAAMAFGYRYTVRQLELAQMKASFVSNVTHELKTPIALIRLAVETLQMRRFTGPEESERFLSTIERETQKLTRLVDNILDLARFESGHHILKMAPVDVRQIALETLENFRPRLEHAGFRVEADLPEGLPPARGDAIALSHCVLNLLDNAVKYSKDDRYIRLSASASNGTVQLSVADHGIGVAPGDRRRIFEKFVRIEHGLVHDAKGAGLGLSLVQQIMRAHRGRVDVTGNPGGGSVFTLVLPTTEAAEAARAAVERSSADS